MHFAELPNDRAQRGPDLPALADQRIGRLSNAQVLAWVEVTADRLSAAGVRVGDVVAVMLPSRVEFVIALFAAWRLRAAVTSVNPTMTPGEVSHQLVDSGARILVCEANAETTVSGLAVVEVPLLPKEIRVRPGRHPDYSDEDLALLVYTSGSTGRPKGVELTHRNIMAMCTSMLSLMDEKPDMHSLLILPLFHVNGIVIGVLTPLLADGQATLAGRFSPSTFFTILEQVRPTFFSAVPAIFAMLAELPPEVTPDTSSVRFAVCGAAPMPPNLLIRFENRYGITIVEGYGLSEATCVSTTNPLHGVRKPGSVGVALPDHEVATMNAAGELITDGSPGEVVVKGPTVMRGYLNRPGDTATAIVDGWLHTGDIGRIDSDGYLTLVDRVKDIIIRGGENIYPKEIESALYAYPDVVEAAVVGRSHPVYGEVPVAFVSLRKDSHRSVEPIQRHLQKRLARYKLPHEIIAVDTIPKNPVGKIDKPALRRCFAATADEPGEVPISESLAQIKSHSEPTAKG
jgi:long-chain acyl-CoA synthetase